MNAGGKRQRVIKVREIAADPSCYPVVLWYLIISFPDNDLAVIVREVFPLIALHCV